MSQGCRPIAPPRGGMRSRGREHSQEGPRKRRRCTPLDFADSITLLVGHNEREYSVPRAALADIPYFKSALSFAKASRPQSTDKRILKLQEVDSDLFNLYSNWLVSSTLPHIPHMREDSTMTKQLVDLWLLGQFLCDTAFQDHIIDIIIATHKSGNMYSAPPLATAVYVWEKAGAQSKLKTLFLDLYMSMGADEIEQQRSDFHNDGIAANTELLFDLYVCRAKRGPRGGLQDAEVYYEKVDASATEPEVDISTPIMKPRSPWDAPITDPRIRW